MHTTIGFTRGVTRKKNDGLLENIAGPVEKYTGTSCILFVLVVTKSMKVLADPQCDSESGELMHPIFVPKKSQKSVPMFA